MSAPDATHQRILGGVRVHGRGSQPRDVVIGRGRIRAMYPAGTAPAYPHAERLDLTGGFLLPGLWDHHVHMNQWALVRRRLDLSAATSAAHCRQIVVDHLAQSDDAHGHDAASADRSQSSFLVGYGFRDGLWPDTPTGEMLELGEHAIALVSGDLHCVWLNSAAMRRLGRPERQGEVLREDEAFAINNELSSPDPAILDEWVMDAAVAAAARGVVGIVDLEIEDAPTLWSRRANTGRDIPLHVRAGVYPERLDAAIARGWRTGTSLWQPGEAEFRPAGHASHGLADLSLTRSDLQVGPLKIITDGSLNTRTAACLDPYPGASGPERFGRPTHSLESLTTLMRRSSEAGFEPAVHAIGDRANTLTLDAFEEVGCTGSIEHAQLICAQDAPRFARLGVRASMQPEHAMDDRDIAERHWPGRTERAFAVGTLARAGADLRLGSDAPVSPLDPWVTIASAVNRVRDGRDPWHPEQRISLEAAIAASSATGGVVAVGDRADLVVTGADPGACTNSELRTMPVALTLGAGRIVADNR